MISATFGCAWATAGAGRAAIAAGGGDRGRDSSGS